MPTHRMSFDAAEFLGATAVLSPGAMGTYVRLVCLMRLHGALDVELMRRAVPGFDDHWDEIRHLFREESGRWIEPRSARAIEIGEARRRAGRTGAETRWQKPWQTAWQNDGKSHGKTMANAMANGMAKPSSSSSSPSLSPAFSPPPHLPPSSTPTSIPFSSTTSVEGAIEKNRTRKASRSTIQWTAESGWTGITDADRARWQAAYPAVDIDAELARATAWLAADPKRRKVQWGRFLVSWFSRTQDRGGTRTEQRTTLFDPLANAERNKAMAREYDRLRLASGEWIATDDGRIVRNPNRRPA